MEHHADANSGHERRFVYADLAATPDDGQSYEIFAGELFVTPAPNPFHQRISKRLMLQLMAHFEARSLGEVFNSPLDLILTSEDVAQPDLLVVGDPGQVSDRGIEGPPLLVVEILSSSTAKKDRGVKSRRYAELGIRHYWIVDPQNKRIEFHRSVGNAYELLNTAEGDVRFAHPDWDGLVLDLAALWR